MIVMKAKVLALETFIGLQTTEVLKTGVIKVFGSLSAATLLQLNMRWKKQKSLVYKESFLNTTRTSFQAQQKSFHLKVTTNWSSVQVAKRRS